MKLLEPFEFAGLRLKNRIVMAPMGSAMGDFDEKSNAYYLRRAAGGAAMLMINVAATRQIEGPSPAELLTEENYEGFRTLVEGAHAHDCRICLQIMPGAGLGMKAEGRARPSSASAVEVFPGSGFFFDELTKDEIRLIQEEVSRTLLLAKRAGVDAVELHAYGGYLTDRFMTRRWNIRRDEYGGNFQNRMRFLNEMIDIAKRDMGEDFPLIVKYTPCHFMPPEAGYRDFAEGLRIARMLEAHGVSALHIDAGCHDNWYLAMPPVYQADMAAQIFACMKVREATDLPLISNGRLGDVDKAESVLRRGSLDLVAIGRGLLADPELPNKILSHRTDEICPCIACNEGCIKSVSEGRHIDCAVNPLAGFETEKAIVPSENPKRVLVIGAGPAGCQAAISARTAGHTVEIWEKNSYLGGNFHNACAPPFKRSGAALLSYYRTMLDRLGVTVRYCHEATAENITAFAPDKIFYAAGGRPIRPDALPGVDGRNVLAATDVLKNHVHVADRVVVVGGGIVGVEVAAMLAMRGKRVVLIETQDDILPGEVFIQNRMMLRQLLQNPNITIHKQTKVMHILENGVVVRTMSGERSIPCDSVVLAMGFEPDTALYDELKENYDITNVGDSQEVRMVIEAVREAHDAVLAM